jgi:DNA-binding NtrC family response regulator
MLGAVGVSPRWVEDAPSALAALARREGIVIADFGDPRAGAFVSEIRRARPATFLLAVTDPSRPGALAEVERARIPGVLHRPLDPRMLSLVLGVQPDEGAARAAPAAQSAKPIVARSAAMRRALEDVERAAASHAGVLLCGEPGSGRALLARQIHDRGARAGGPFVRVDCAEAAGDELEAALFGAVAPAHGDAGERRRVERVGAGCALAAACGGTLYLAHLADAPARVQARLARALRDGEVTVGDARRPTVLNLRPIASAGPRWDAAVAEGGVRDELARRVAAVRVDVPPLRERRDDLPLLAACMLDAACRLQGIGLKSLDSPALAVLAALPWRGNGHELVAVLGALVRQAPGPVINLEHVLATVNLDAAEPRTPPSGTLRDARSRFEREYITATLEQHRGRVPEAARALGIQRANLYRKMRLLRIGWRGYNGGPWSGGPSSGGASNGGASNGDPSTRGGREGA